MTLRTIARRSSLVTQVTQRLRAHISSGQWQVGMRIPTEPELVAQLGVGRNTVREAVQALTHVGLLERRQGSGTYVTARSEVTGLVAHRLAGSDPDSVAPAAVREAAEVRRAFEVEAARLAARRRTGADLAALDAALTHLRQAWDDDDVDAYIEADARLHTAVISAAHNSILTDLYEEFGAALRTAIAANVGEALHPGRRIDHTPLVEAIRAGDSAAAALAATAPLDPPPTAVPPDPPDRSAHPATGG